MMNFKWTIFYLFLIPITGFGKQGTIWFNNFEYDWFMTGESENDNHIGKWELFNQIREDVYNAGFIWFKYDSINDISFVNKLTHNETNNEHKQELILNSGVVSVLNHTGELNSYGYYEEVNECNQYKVPDDFYLIEILEEGRLFDVEYFLEEKGFERIDSFMYTTTPHPEIFEVESFDTDNFAGFDYPDTIQSNQYWFGLWDEKLDSVYGIKAKGLLQDGKYFHHFKNEDQIDEEFGTAILLIEKNGVILYQETLTEDNFTYYEAYFSDSNYIVLEHSYDFCGGGAVSYGCENYKSIVVFEASSLATVFEGQVYSYTSGFNNMVEDDGEVVQENFLEEKKLDYKFEDGLFKMKSEGSTWVEYKFDSNAKKLIKM